MSKTIFNTITIFVLLVGILAGVATVNGQYLIKIDGNKDIAWNGSPSEFFVSPGTNTGTTTNSAYVNWLIDEQSSQLFLLFFVDDSTVTQEKDFGITGYINNKKVFTFMNNSGTYCANGYKAEYAFHVFGYGGGYILEVKLILPNIPDKLTLGISLTDSGLNNSQIKYVELFVRETTTIKQTTTKPLTTKITTTKTPATKSATDTSALHIVSNSITSDIQPTSDIVSDNSYVTSNVPKNYAHEDYALYEEHSDQTTEENFVNAGVISNNDADDIDFSTANTSKKPMVKRIIATVVAALMIAGAVLITIFTARSKKKEKTSE